MLILKQQKIENKLFLDETIESCINWQLTLWIKCFYAIFSEKFYFNILDTQLFDNNIMDNVISEFQESYKYSKAIKQYVFFYKTTQCRTKLWWLWVHVCKYT